MFRCVRGFVPCKHRQARLRFCHIAPAAAVYSTLAAKQAHQTPLHVAGITLPAGVAAQNAVCRPVTATERWSASRPGASRVR